MPGCGITIHSRASGSATGRRREVARQPRGQSLEALVVAIRQQDGIGRAVHAVRYGPDPDLKRPDPPCLPARRLGFAPRSQ